MCRFTSVGWAYIVPVLTWLFLPLPSHAQTLPFAAASDFQLLLCVAMALLTATAFVEAEVIWRVVRKPVGVWRKLAEWSFLINLVTLIPAIGLLVAFLNCFAAVPFGPSGFAVIVAVLTVGLLITGLEFAMLVWVLRRLCRKGDLPEPISTLRVVVAALAANVVSALIFIGLAALLSSFAPIAPGPWPEYL